MGATVAMTVTARVACVCPSDALTKTETVTDGASPLNAVLKPTSPLLASMVNPLAVSAVAGLVDAKA